MDITQAANAVQTREHTYELTYNSACALIAQEKYIEAEQKLNKAEGKLNYLFFFNK